MYNTPVETTYRMVDGMKTLLVLVATFSLFMVACSPVGSGGGFGTDSSFNLSAYSYVPDDIDFGINDIVSPEIITLPDGQMLLYTTGGGGISVYRSTDGLSFTKTSATTPQGSDPTVVATADGRYRMYYLDHLDNTIKTAISDDALNFTNEGSTGIQNSTGTQAWGVPDTIVLPDGRVRIYWVDHARQSTSKTLYRQINRRFDMEYRREPGGDTARWRQCPRPDSGRTCGRGRLTESISALQEDQTPWVIFI